MSATRGLKFMQMLEDIFVTQSLTHPPIVLRNGAEKQAHSS